MAGDAKGAYRGLLYRNDADLHSWLTKRPPEVALEPDLSIIDPHHHFWDTPQRGRYVLPDLLADVGGGHHVVATVFLECQAMYRKHGPAAMAPLGEVEFVNGIAAMSASGHYGPCRVAEAIIGHADLTLGARVREVLEAQMAVSGGRFRGIRYGVAWDGSEAVGKYVSRVVPPSSEELAAAWRQYVEPCIEAFGPERCMFESNFPPDKQSCGYTELWNAFKRITAGASAAEKQALYSGTAARVYRLTVP